jgi:hypothetical protein
MTVGVVVGAPTLAQAAPLGSDVSYPLRHKFSMAVGLPGAGKHEPTSCYDKSADSNEYLCRIVAGVEETGDKRNFFVAAKDVLSKGSDPRFGAALVDANGTQFEGCDAVDDWTYECDYASRLQVSREHYEAGHWVLKVLWSWRKYTQSQAGCAAALSGVWVGGPGKAFLALLENCLNAPMERPK